jgi:hypothetical protein
VVHVVAEVPEHVPELPVLAQVCQVASHVAVEVLFDDVVHCHQDESIEDAVDV